MQQSLLIRLFIPLKTRIYLTIYMGFKKFHTPVMTSNGYHFSMKTFSCPGDEIVLQAAEIDLVVKYCTYVAGNSSAFTSSLIFYRKANVASSNPIDTKG